MKRLLIAMLSTLWLCQLPAAAGGRDEAISFEALPKAAQDFCRKHFGDLTVAYVVADRKLMGAEYEVTYTDRTEIDFRSDGSWESVERKYAAVPGSIVPAAISSYLAANAHLRDAAIRKIERGRYSWEIELATGVEIKFDTKFNVIDIDYDD